MNNDVIKIMYKLEADFFEGDEKFHVLNKTFDAENNKDAKEKAIELIGKKIKNSKYKNNTVYVWYKLLKSNELFKIQEIKHEALEWVNGEKLILR